MVDTQHRAGALCLAALGCGAPDPVQPVGGTRLPVASYPSASLTDGSTTEEDTGLTGDSGSTHGTFTGDAGAVRFSALMDSITVPPNEAYHSPGGFTWTVWFQPSDPPTSGEYGDEHGQTMITVADGTSCEDVYLGFGSTFTRGRELTFVVDGPGGCDARDTRPLAYDQPGGYVVDQWYFAAASYDPAADRAVLYLDGVPVASRGAWNPGHIPGAMNATIGRWSHGPTPPNYNWFHGALDEVRMYARVLTEAEILAMWDEGRGTYGVPEPDLVGGWHLDDGIGSVAADYSGNGNDGQLRAGATWVDGWVEVP